jgi:major vault protein
MASIIRIAPYEYIHVLNNNTNVTRVIEGPKTYTRREHERVVLGPEGMVTIPPRCYVTIFDPVMRDENGVVMDSDNCVKLQYGETEIRLQTNYQEPFPLYPGESISGDISELPVLEANEAYRVKALRDFDGHSAGEEWLFEGPATYIPRVEETVVDQISATIVRPDTAIRIKAIRKTTDRDGNQREAGEEWLVSANGAYLPGVDETIVDTNVKARVLTEKNSTTPCSHQDIH